MQGEKIDSVKEVMEKYRDQLLDAGLKEPLQGISSSLLFYKPMTALTAFVVNLTGTDVGVEVVYGYASTAFTRLAGCENSLINNGVSNGEVTIREYVLIRNEEDEEQAKIRIRQMYDRYQYTEKEELLVFAKEKRKEFVKPFAVRLKPLGFKKKANTWARNLTEEFYLMFNLQKSMYSDDYYFNIYIGKHGTNDYGDCYYTRMHPKELWPTDWQTLPRTDLEHFIDEELVPVLEHVIQTPLQELGKEEFIRSHCDCNRKKCERCWVEN